MKTLLPTLAAAGTLLAMTSSARADEARASVDWVRTLARIDRFARTGAERPMQAGAQPREQQDERPPATPNEPYAQNPGNAWFGVAPHVAFVARDWRSSFKLAGDSLTLVDALRLSHSTRMVITRVRLGDLKISRVTPFAQIGLGQFRTDRRWMPFTPLSTEIAGQIGGGVEIRVSRAWQLAAEYSATGLYREEREANDIPQTGMWSVMLASRLAF